MRIYNISKEKRYAIKNVDYRGSSRVSTDKAKHVKGMGKKWNGQKL